jgi:hypothetical protein
MTVVDSYDLAVGCQGKLRHLGGFRFFLEGFDYQFDQQ